MQVPKHAPTRVRGRSKNRDGRFLLDTCLGLPVGDLPRSFDPSSCLIKQAEIPETTQARSHHALHLVDVFDIPLCDFGIESCLLK